MRTFHPAPQEVRTNSRKGLIQVALSTTRGTTRKASRYV
ncbi:hypothetical protein SynPROSU1_02036 [Synechococcus sp. PROS-U-1]|nr:hypothetical protein SynPROSU1_02036 [Synechococcus sp. PROS-U-1]